MNSLFRIEPLYRILHTQPDVIVQLKSQFNLPKNLNDYRVTDNTLDDILVFLQIKIPQNNIAWQLGWCQNIFSLGDLAYLMLSCKDLEEALTNFYLYRTRLAITSDSLVITSKYKQINFLIDTSTPNVKAMPQRKKMIVGMVMRYMQALCGPTCFPQEMLLQDYGINDFGDLKQNSIGKIHIGDTTSVTFSDQWLNLPLAGTNNRLKQHLLDTSIDLAGKLSWSSTLSEKIVLWLTHMDTLHEANSSLAAKHFEMAERTLVRKLNEEGSNFRDILSSTKHFKAISLLISDKDISLIASKLGFSDRKSFERAFLKRTGIRPAQFKKEYNSFTDIQNTANKSDTNNPQSISSVADQLLTIIENGQEDTNILVEAISLDPIICAKVLGAMNSRFFGGFNITSLQTGLINRLGSDWLKNLIVSTVGTHPIRLKSKDTTKCRKQWIAMIFAATLAKRFSKLKNIGVMSSHEMYLCIILQECGSLGLQQQNPENFTECEQKMQSNCRQWSLNTRVELQRTHMGQDAFNFSSQLLAQWGVSAKYSKIIRQIGEYRIDGDNHLQVQLLRGCIEMAMRFVFAEHKDTNRLCQLAEATGIESEKVIICFHQFLEQYPYYQQKSRELFR